MANRPPTNRYLRPWSVVEDEELRELREIRRLCEVLRHRGEEEVVYMQGCSDGPFEMGKVAEAIRKLRGMGR